jgi:hypothetical protein
VELPGKGVWVREGGPGYVVPHIDAVLSCEVGWTKVDHLALRDEADLVKHL